MTKRPGFWAARGKGKLAIFAYTAVSRKGIRRDADGDWMHTADTVLELYSGFLRWYGIPLKPGEGPVFVVTRRGGGSRES